jgi:carbamoyltransferase
MIILGVSDGTDGSAALVVDQRVVAAVQQDRIDRMRGSSAFPSGAIDAVLDRAGLRARDVRRVAVATSLDAPGARSARHDALQAGTGSSGRGFGAPGPLARLDALPGLREGWHAVQAAFRFSGLHMLERQAAQRAYEVRFRDLGFVNASVELVEHDRAHANAAYRTQPRDPVLVVTLDTPGDGASVTVSVARHLQLERLFLQTSLASVATLQPRVAALLGVSLPQLAALAADGRPPPSLRAAFDREVRARGDGFNLGPLRAARSPLRSLVAAHAPADVAAAAEDAVGDTVRAFIAGWIARTGVGDVALGGTLAEDARLCAALLDTPGLRTLWVFPPAGDAGLAVGAALAAAGSAVGPVPDLDLGPRYTDDDCYRQLSVASLPRDKVDDPDATVAELVARGEVVCRFTGGVELGPRALGNRSVLFRADDLAVRARAQQLLGRDPARPVACAVSDDVFDAAFPDAARVPDAARFATVALRASAAFAAAHPGVVHADGTALAQRVRPSDPLAPVLAAYRTRSGSPVLAQTSFNASGAPVVCSPNDAIRVWRDHGLDALLLGPYCVSSSASTGSARQNEAKPTQSSPAR